MDSLRKGEVVGGMKTVLIVDDNKEDLRTLKSRLESHGYNVASAANGVEALKTARKSPPDVILSDTQMPVMDGFTLCREWKRDKQLNTIPFVFCTAVYTDAAELRRRAEGIAREKAAQSPHNPDALSPEETRQTLHELRVHQIELEMQNEELRRAQVDLDAARGRYFDLYDLAPVGYFTVSEKGLILEANLTAAALLGVARGALVKQLLTRFILKDDQDIYYQHRKQLFATGMPWVCELRMVKKDGAQFWARMEAAAAQDGESESTVCRVVVSDITERKKVEENLLWSEERFRQVAESAGEWIWEVDAEGLYIYASPVVEKILGYKPDEVVGKMHFFNLFIPEARERAKKLAFETFAKHELLRGFQNPCLHENGTTVILETRGGPVLDDHGRLLGYCGVCTDVTDRRRAEERLQYISAHDALTGIYNRAYFEEEFERLKRGRGFFPMSVVMVDVDGMKAVNDSLGHAAGDAVLQAAAVVLVSTFRSEDVVARIGGDEFAVLLPAADRATAEKAVTRVRKILSMQNRNVHGLLLSLSVGVASGEKGCSLSEVLREADENMYREKELKKVKV
jgi:diguanylate cyclase (GGDEF)-like protein/PAS domain S-box-containing protein